MNQDSERVAITLLCLIVFALMVNTRSMNEESFNTANPVIYFVKTNVGNLRSGPSTKEKLIHKMNYGEGLILNNKRDNWYQVTHLVSKKEGWAHKNIIMSYLYLRYYKDEPEEDKSLLEIEF